MPVIKMVDNAKKISLAQNKRAGVMGWPVEHSLSPRLHDFWLKAYGIDGDYIKLAVEPEKLAAELSSLRAKGFIGVNLTVPHKERALTIVDRLDPVARCVGAVNTIIVGADGKLEGGNTDVFGLKESLRLSGFKPRTGPTGTAAILGAGGAARAATAALLGMGMKDIRIINRTLERAEKLKHDFGAGVSIFGWGDENALKDVQLLVNATSLGLKGQPPLEISLDDLAQAAWVTDMVYVPLETDFLKRAKAKGHKTVDGLGMLLHQGRPAFSAFFGIDPEVTDKLRSYVLEGLK